MAFTTTIKNLINTGLRPLGLRLDTLTAERIEEARIRALDEAGYYNRPSFPLLPSFAAMEIEPLLDEVASHRERFDTFRNPALNDVGFSYENDFFSTVDAEILYTLVRRTKPGKIVEIGCGNSTRVARQAILDGKLDTRLVCIDPQPRVEVAALADELHRFPVERLPSLEIFESLAPGDILFIDSSHELRSGNDCAFLYLTALPKVAKGVLVHVHDVFLPYDYPAKYPATLGWAEQYLTHLILSDEAARVHWSSYYLLESRPELRARFSEPISQIPSASCWFTLG